MIPNKNNKSLHPVEVLINTPSIKSLIRETNIHQIDKYILSGIKDGTDKDDDSIVKLFNDGLISKEEAASLCY